MTEGTIVEQGESGRSPEGVEKCVAARDHEAPNE